LDALAGRKVQSARKTRKRIGLRRCDLSCSYHGVQVEENRSARPSETSTRGQLARCPSAKKRLKRGTQGHRACAQAQPQNPASVTGRSPVSVGMNRAGPAGRGPNTLAQPEKASSIIIKIFGCASNLQLLQSLQN